MRTLKNFKIWLTQASCASSIETGLAFALEVGSLRNENTVSVSIAMLVTFSSSFARIGAFGLWCGGGVFCAVIGWTSDARCLLRFWLVEAFAAFNANVDRGIKVSSWCTDGQWTFFNRSWSNLRCCTSQWTSLAGWLDALSSEGSTRAWLAFAVNSKLHSRSTFVTTFASWFGFSCSSCLSQAANLTLERSLVGLEESIAAWSTKAGFRVEILSGWTTLLAISSWTSPWSDCDTCSARDVWTLRALRLTGFRLVSSSWAVHTSLVGCFVERAYSTWHTVRDHRNLTSGASVFGSQEERSWVWNGVWQNVFDSELIFLQNQLLKQFLDGRAFSARRVKNWVAKVRTSLFSIIGERVWLLNWWFKQWWTERNEESIKKKRRPIRKTFTKRFKKQATRL